MECKIVRLDVNFSWLSTQDILRGSHASRERLTCWCGRRCRVVCNRGQRKALFVLCEEGHVLKLGGIYEDPGEEM